MKAIPFLILALGVSFCLSCSGKTEISGEVFIVTAGAGNYKLGLVKVAAIPEKYMTAYFAEQTPRDLSAQTEELNAAKAQLEEAKKQLSSAESKIQSVSSVANIKDLETQHWATKEVDRAKNIVSVAGTRVSRAEVEINTPLGPESYFKSFPPAVMSSTTDSDGKYALDIPVKGKYLIVANATRKAGSISEDYYWAVWVTADGKPQKLTLSNDNEFVSLESIKK